MSEKLFQLQVVQKLSAFSLNVNLTIPNRKVIAIYGESGSGKSTLLRIMSGLDHVCGNLIQFKDQVWQDSKLFVQPYFRQIGMIFQDPYLFPHLNVKDNLVFANQFLDIQLLDKLVKDFSLQHLLFRFPHKLSGGERQKIALARALLNSPQVLFLDEPFAAIDQQTGIFLLEYLMTINLPIILISHNVDEILSVADYLIHICDGQIIRHGDISKVLPYLNGYSKYDLYLEVEKTNNSNILSSWLGLINVPTWLKDQQTSRVIINTANLKIKNRTNSHGVAVQIDSFTHYKDYIEINCSINNKHFIIPYEFTKFMSQNFFVGQQLHLEINSFKFV